MRCCGLRGRGYTDYETLPGAVYRFPDSCCFDYGTGKPTENCSERFKLSSSNNVNELEYIDKIYMRGCIDILKNVYQASFMRFSMLL